MGRPGAARERRFRNVLLGSAIVDLLLFSGFVAWARESSPDPTWWIPVATALGAVAVFGIVMAVAMRVRAATAMQEQARRLAGHATVVAFRQGDEISDDPHRMEFDLDVSVPGRPAYRATYADWVPDDALRRMAVGATLPVRADPTDPTNLLIQWDRWGPGWPTEWVWR